MKFETIKFLTRYSNLLNFIVYSAISYYMGIISVLTKPSIFKQYDTCFPQKKKKHYDTI